MNDRLKLNPEQLASLARMIDFHDATQPRETWLVNRDLWNEHMVHVYNGTRLEKTTMFWFVSHFGGEMQTTPTIPGRAADIIVSNSIPKYNETGKETCFRVALPPIGTDWLKSFS